ncbi:src kinase-associated phosphoprotein 2 [Camelus ferus]|nr:src kinase-associated phosphoprotein 2 [Camelus ferus]
MVEKCSAVAVIPVAKMAAGRFRGRISYLQEFQDKGDAEGGEEYDDPFAGPQDNISLASERYDKDDEAHSDGNQFPPIAAQDLPFVLKAGYLEKRRKDHSFLGFEWQKRWCALSKTVFYYYGSDKDKQQKGEFAIDGYNIRMNNTLRKDGKKDCCFEISAPDKRIYQFTAASPKDAEEWVQQLRFVLQDMGSDVIPEDDDERGELYDDVDHSLPISSSPASSQPIDDEIYEELPEEEEDGAPVKVEAQRKMSQDSVHHTTGDKSTDYANFYQGLWDCTGALSDELSFKRGDVIYILSKIKGLFIILSVLLKYSHLPVLAFQLQLRAAEGEGYQMADLLVPEISCAIEMT